MRIHDFALKPSYFYLILLSSVFLMSIGSILYLPIFWLYKAVLLIACGAYGKRIFERDGLLKHRHSIKGLTFLSDNLWLIKTSSQAFEARLLPNSIVTHLTLVLNFKTAKEDQHLSCVIFPDALLQDEFRQLLVILRMF